MSRCDVCANKGNQRFVYFANNIVVSPIIDTAIGTFQDAVYDLSQCPMQTRRSLDSKKVIYEICPSSVLTTSNLAGISVTEKHIYTTSEANTKMNSEIAEWENPEEV